MGGDSSELLDWRIKGAPALPSGTTVADFLAGAPSLFDAGFVPPVMVLRETALAHNIATMAAYCADAGVSLAPHGKTHMSPQLAHRQLAAGAWAITVATPWQARVYRAAGVARIFLANQLVDAASIAWVAAELQADPQFEFCCYVDSVDGVSLLDATLATAPGDRACDVVVEIGAVGARTGARTVEQAQTVAAAAADCPRLRLVGVAGFEGGFASAPIVDDDDIAEVREFLRLIHAAGEAIAPWVSESQEFIASAGGSVYFDLVTEEFSRPWSLPNPVRVVIRSGCYLSHDHGSYLHRSPFDRRIPGSLIPALELWAPVLSIPEPGLALCCAGKRDLPHDMGMPVPTGVRRGGSIAELPGITVTKLNDQHGYLNYSGAPPFGVGDWLRFGISHPCTAFDKWSHIPVVDDDYQVIDYVRTYF